MKPGLFFFFCDLVIFNFLKHLSGIHDYFGQIILKTRAARLRAITFRLKLNLCINIFPKQSNFEFDPNIDKTRNLDRKC